METSLQANVFIIGDQADHLAHKQDTARPSTGVRTGTDHTRDRGVRVRHTGS